MQHLIVNSHTLVRKTLQQEGGHYNLVPQMPFVSSFPSNKVTTRQWAPDIISRRHPGPQQPLELILLGWGWGGEHGWMVTLRPWGPFFDLEAPNYFMDQQWAYFEIWFPEEKGKKAAELTTLENHFPKHFPPCLYQLPLHTNQFLPFSFYLNHFLIYPLFYYS